MFIAEQKPVEVEGALVTEGLIWDNEKGENGAVVVCWEISRGDNWDIVFHRPNEQEVLTVLNKWNA